MRHPVVAPFRPNDSIFVLAANNPISVADDVWKIATVTSVGVRTTCNGSDTAQVLTIGGTTVGAPPDSIGIGAPVRGFVHYTYGLFQVGGETFLGRRVAGTVAGLAMVGPLKRIDDVPTFTYWTRSGTAAVLPAEVATIRIVLRTSSVAPGGVIQDSLIVDIHPRN